MSAEHTLEAMKKFCQLSTGSDTTFKGNKATYQWNKGRTTTDGTINGVIRKLEGTDTWKLAGSLKILPDGKITHFTGLSKKNWALLEGIKEITITAELKATENV